MDVIQARALSGRTRRGKRPVSDDQELLLLAASLEEMAAEVESGSWGKS